jgi:hypothetical protein
MRRTSFTSALITAAILVTATASSPWAADYESRFIRDYPPGYYGMWYYAERFFDRVVEGRAPEETYRWDRYISRMTDVYYPFFPIPYDWDYGSQRKFNLPDYNSNDWP